MLEILKALFNSPASHTMADYYQSRLQSSDNVVEVEGILAINALLSLTEDNQQSEPIK